jgi:hypothetical protein
MEYSTGGGPDPAGAPETAPTRVTRPLGTRASTAGGAGLGRRLATETKQAFKTTEFWIYLVILLGLLLAGLIADADEGSSVDGFGANQVWLYAVILTVGYLISRGLAKSGSRDPYWDEPDADEDETSIGERVRAAAHVLKDGPDA